MITASAVVFLSSVSRRFSSFFSASALMDVGVLYVQISEMKGGAKSKAEQNKADSRFVYCYFFACLV